MKELKEKVQALIDKYTPELSSKGLKILLSKRYFESAVGERIGATGTGAIFNSIDRARDRNKEKRYHYVKNRYHYFILTLSPIQKHRIKREELREYAVAVKKIERPHIGLEPRLTVSREDKVLSRIEKRIQKVIKKAEKSTPEKLCQNTIIDAFRYAMHPKYEYKERFFGKGRFTWEMIFLAVFCIAVFGSLFVVWLITR